MGELTDRYGLALSTRSAAAAEHYRDGIDRTLASLAGADACFEAAVAADEGFALAQVALARGLQFQGRVPEARERAADARKLAGGVTGREASHIATIATAIEQGGAPALGLVYEHLREFPRDAFVLSQATGVYGLIGFSGSRNRNAEQIDLLNGVADVYGDDWWFLSALAFAHNELFETETARRLVERSLALEPRNAHGAHTMAHVFYESGDSDGGRAFLDPWLAAYERAAQLHCHLSWHLALFELASGRTDRVMELYAQNISPAASSSNPLGTLADAASLLWRCDLYGGLNGALPWQDARDFAARSFPRQGVTWADVHAALAYAAANDNAALSAVIDGLRERAAAGKLPPGEGVIDLVQGLAAFARGEYEDAVRWIEPVADEIIRLGGSHAQREVFEDTLLEAYLRAGRHEQAETMLRARLERRPSPRDLLLLGRTTTGRTLEQRASR